MIIASGRWGSVIWGENAQEARRFFDEIEPAHRKSLISRMRVFAADFDARKPWPKEQFRELKGYPLFEFKKGPVRLFGGFRGKKFVIVHGAKKSTGTKMRREYEKAVRLLREYDNLEQA